MSVAVDGFPNMFLMYGPGSGVNTNSTISMLESQAMYIVKCAAKLQRERLKAMAPKKEATADWMQHMRVGANTANKTASRCSYIMPALLPENGVHGQVQGLVYV